MKKATTSALPCARQRESLGFGPRTVFLSTSRSESLARPVVKFLAGFDILVHEAFGQPESCGMLTANIPKRYCKMGTFGKPVPGVKSKVDSSSVQMTSLAKLVSEANMECGEVRYFNK